MSYLEELQAVILVGGLGTRLRPITETIPKPMVEILGKPFLEYKINQIKNQGIKNILLCVGYLGEKIQDYFKDGKNFGVNIKYSFEEELLGTAGAIKNAERLIDTDSFFVMNGDTFLNLSFQNLFSVYNRKKFPLTISISRATNPLEQELIEMEKETITHFHQRGSEDHSNYLSQKKIPLMNAGVYIFNKEILNIIPYQKKYSLEKDIFPKYLGRMGGFFHKGYIKDLANIQFCKELEMDLISGASYDS